MKSDNVKDKEAKINFLQKAIDVVIMVTGEPLSAKPARIVAGHEPEKTNELLQAIAKCCLNKLSSDEAVKRILTGEKTDIKGKLFSSKSRDKENRESKTEEHKIGKDKECRGETEIKDRSTSRERKSKEELKEESKQKEKGSEKHKDHEDRRKDLEMDTYKESGKHESEESKNKTKQGKDMEKSKDKKKQTERNKDLEREKKNEGGREKERLRERERDKDHEKDKERGKDREKRRERGKYGEQLGEQGKEKADKKPIGSDETVVRKTSERSTKDTNPEPEKESESPARLPRQLSTKGLRQRAKPGGDEGECENIAASEKAGVSENGEIANDLLPHITQRRLPRPSSARPATPRIKQQESTEILLPERNGSAKIVSNVIIDKENSSEEDDQFVVEAAPPLPEILETEMETSAELDGVEKHGGLVKRILETKKDYESSQLKKSTEKDKPLLSEATRRKEKDLVSKEIEKFQASIQTLCRSALPLGKIMDYIQEDMDAMKNELQMWQHENKQHAGALQKEQR
uniref:TRAF3-interacting protein 1 n=1 Tax=Sphenodon punctatus TaxID=8508 RepID=A0A8D0HI98_SPHPU